MTLNVNPYASYHLLRTSEVTGADATKDNDSPGTAAPLPTLPTGYRNDTLPLVPDGAPGALQINRNGRLMTTIAAADTPLFDAFGRMRVADPEFLFDANFQYDLAPLLFDQFTSGSGATITYDTQDRAAIMAFAATPAGGESYMQTFEHFRYQAGRSQLIFATGSWVESAANVIKFLGYSNGTDGIEYRLNGSTPQFAILSSTTTPTEVVNQVNWNIDPMDGTGPSGLTLDITQGFILAIDFQWLSLGRVRLGFDIDGIVIPCHEFNHANLTNAPYMATGNLPVRAGMTCSDTATTSMIFICASVASEGGEPDLGGFSFAQEGTAPAADGVATHILSLRPKTSFNSLSPYVTFVLERLDFLVTGADPVKWELVLSQNITGTTTFNDVNTTYSTFEYNSAGTADGAPAVVIASGYVAASRNITAGISQLVAQKFPITLDSQGAQRALGTLSLLVTGIGGASACRATMNWREIR